MTTAKFEIGQEVVRSKGDYVVGRIGNVIALDLEKGRAQVEWKNYPKSWVAFNSLELTSIPYTFSEYSYDPKTGKHKWPKYIKA